MKHINEKRRSLFENTSDDLATSLSAILQMSYHLVAMENAQINGLLLMLTHRLSQIKDESQIQSMIHKLVTEKRYATYNPEAITQVTDLWKKNYYVPKEEHSHIDHKSQGDFASLRARFTTVCAS